MEKRCRSRQATYGNIILRMRFACRITKATDTHSVYVILIAFTRKQWLSERASMLRYTYFVCLVNLQSVFTVSTERFKRSQTYPSDEQLLVFNNYRSSLQSPQNPASSSHPAPAEST